MARDKLKLKLDLSESNLARGYNQKKQAEEQGQLASSVYLNRTFLEMKDEEIGSDSDYKEQMEVIFARVYDKEIDENKSVDVRENSYLERAMVSSNMNVAEIEPDKFMEVESNHANERVISRKFLVESLKIPSLSNFKNSMADSVLDSQLMNSGRTNKTDNSKNSNAQSTTSQNSVSKLSSDSQMTFKLAGNSGVNKPNISKFTYYSLVFSYLFKITRVYCLEPFIDIISLVIAA